MATPPVLRVVEREALVFRRLWRGLGVLDVPHPVLFLAAMGLGLGGLVDDAHAARSTALDLPRLRRARPAGRERDAASRPASRCGRCSAA